MYNKLIGIILILVHIYFIEKKLLYRMFTLSDWSVFLLGLSFILLDKFKWLPPLAISLTITSLLGKMLLLGKYNIKNTDDFITHYLSTILGLLLFTYIRKKDYVINYKLFALFFGIFFIVHHVYKLLRNEWVYRKIDLYTINGNQKLILYIIMCFSIYYSLYHIKQKI